MDDSASRLVSVIIVNYNGGGFLSASVARALASDVSVEVIVVDNDSRDQSITQLKRDHASDDGLKILELGNNRGFGAAVNAGVKAASGRWVMLLNPDCFVRTDTVGGLVAVLQENADAGIAGPLVFDTAGVEQRGARRHEPTPARAMARTFGRSAAHDGSRAGYDLNSTPLPDGPSAVDAVSGSCMMLSRKLFDELGAMDEGFFLHCEDLDLCRRARDAGRNILFVPNLSVIHVQGASGRNVRVEWYKHRSMVLYFNKHFSDGTPLWQSLFLKGGVWMRFAVVTLLARLRGAFPRGEAEELARINALLAPVTPGCVVVTGATSFVAEPLISQLRAQGRTVIAVSRRVPVHLDAESRWISFDYFSKVVATDFGDAAALVHLAPLWVLPDCIAALSGHQSLRIVAVGSSSVETKRGSTDPGEQAVVARLADAENSIKEAASRHGHVVTVIHPTMIYDSARRDQNVGRVARFAQRFRVLPVVEPAPGLRQPLHADDLARLCVAALDRRPATPERLFVGGGEALSYREMMERIARSASARPIKIPSKIFRKVLEAAGKVPFGPDLNGAMVDRFSQDLCFANDEARERYQFEPRAFEPPSNGHSRPDSAIIAP